MAAIGNTALTYTDWAKRYNDGRISVIVELLSQTNEILDDMRWVEGNLPTGHRTSVRTGLPQGTWRQLNYGVQPTKSTTTQITDACGMLETYSEIDKALADLNGNSAEFRLSEDKAFLEGLSQQLAQTLFYGNTATSPEKFMGLAPRFNTASGTAAISQNVIDAGGTGADNTSVWLVVWGDLTVHGIFPKGSKAGLQMRDLGEQTLTDINGNRFQGYRTHYKWDAGLTVRDWRYAVRIANIDVSDLSAPTPPDLTKFMIKATHKVPSLKTGQPVFYMNRTGRQWLDIQAATKDNVMLKISEFEGRPVREFLGIPIRTCDQILNTEPRVI
ncbi:MAG: major capsid protein [Alphaproteobacteria bacterium]